MSDETSPTPSQGEECISKRPWSEVLNRSLKLFTFNLAREGGRSFGRVVFYVILALLGLFVITVALDAVTGWFSGWFDFWPFNRAPAAEESSGWFGFGKSETPSPPPEPEVKWYCKWNPVC